MKRGYVPSGNNFTRRRTTLTHSPFCVLLSPPHDTLTSLNSWLQFQKVRFFLAKSDCTSSYLHLLILLTAPQHHLSPSQPLGPQGPSYPEMAKEAVSNALQDSGVPYEAIQAAVSLSTPVWVFFCLFSEEYKWLINRGEGHAPWRAAGRLWQLQFIYNLPSKGAWPSASAV